MKLIIDIDEEDRKDIGNMHFVREDLKFKIGKAIIHGTPLDEVRAEIAEEICLTDNPYTKETKFTIEYSRLLDILENIGKESEGVSE